MIISGLNNNLAAGRRLQAAGHRLKIIIYSAIAVFIFLTSGCATIIEGLKGFAGISTKVLEEAREDAAVKKFNYSYDECFQKVEKILTERGSYIYAQDKKKKMLAIYISSEDTTPVGIFFEAIDPQNTQVEISSPSTYGREFIAKRVFPYLENPEMFEDEKGQIYAEEEAETEKK